MPLAAATQGQPCLAPTLPYVYSHRHSVPKTATSAASSFCRCVGPPRLRNGGPAPRSGHHWLNLDSGRVHLRSRYHTYTRSFTWFHTAHRAREETHENFGK